MAQITKKFCLCKIREPKTVVEAELLHQDDCYSVLSLLEDPRAPELPREKYTVAIGKPQINTYCVLADFECLTSAQALFLEIASEIDFQIAPGECKYEKLAIAVCKFCKPGDRWGQRSFDMLRNGKKP